MDGLISMARANQPGLIVANRTVGDAYEDFITPEHQIPDEPLDQPWESCLVIAQNWKYHPRDRYKPTIEILEMLVDIISKSGNLLLGVGPTPEGEFPPEAVERLAGHPLAARTGGLPGVPPSRGAGLPGQHVRRRGAAAGGPGAAQQRAGDRWAGGPRRRRVAAPLSASWAVGYLPAP